MVGSQFGMQMGMGMGMGMGGESDHPSLHFQWVRRHAIIREDDLCPTSDPLAAAEKLFGSRKFLILEDFDFEQAKSSLRSQAFSMASELVQLLPEPGDAEAEQRAWEARLKRAKELNIVWDEEQQRFARK
jgi:hypothetical protein